MLRPGLIVLSLTISNVAVAQVRHPACPAVQPYVRCVVSPANLPPGTPFTSCDYQGGNPGDQCICSVPGRNDQGSVQCTAF